jgi:probable phosphoglycerate mutase
MTTYPRRCVLIRHGETAWSLTGQHTGRTDLPLLPEGEVQAAALAPRVGSLASGLVLCSPLLRARRTCELAVTARAVVDPDLAEWDYGAYEGRTTDDIRVERPGWDLFGDGAPDGECAADAGRRVDRVIRRIREAPGDVTCVAHGHVLRVLAARWVGLPPEGARYLSLSPASVSELGWEHDQPVITHWNQV